MMANRGARSAEGAPRGTERHVPVLLAQMLHAIAARDGQSYIDATFGAGGYSEAILTAARGARVLAIDRDPIALAAGHWLAEQHPGRLQLREGQFGDLDRLAAAAGFAPADGVVLDVGVSSMQLDDPERGFSFQGDGPLDMRMSLRGPTAADVVNTVDEAGLADILFHLGEEKSARSIARAIVARRHQRPIARTSELAQLVARVLGREKIAGRHAATRTFQALRIYVNDELFELAAGLGAAERVLAPGGRLVVVTFHSLEDRLVKQFFRERAAPAPQASRHLPPQAKPQPRPSFQFLNHRPVSPTDTEVAANPRARSARLRAAVRTDASAWDGDSGGLSLPRLGPHSGSCLGP
ncbi:MAG: 16S rRNA (cytosine(1402)-N(4))-methyltransferase RsmH [Hyphomicrobiaceae bacterium]|nr:16S rRNA (cytosine(1402)-N(4))-methyltransferase RsmH [Hyphomicrobiaceae bacterium]